MGLFFSLTGIINKTENEVLSGLKNYLSSVGGGIEQTNVDKSDRNFCSILDVEGNTTVMYPAYFMFDDVDKCSKSLSKYLKAPVFSLNIYDGDFWMYNFFFDGELIDQFMPIPDYFDENVSDEEIKHWKGNAQLIANYIPNLKKESIDKYLVRWDLDNDEVKAYEDDKFTNCDYQLIDFMKKLRLPYPIDDEDNTYGTTFKFWTNALPLTTDKTPSDEYVSSQNELNPQKPWWMFW